jgi:hypothetical protein
MIIVAPTAVVVIITPVMVAIAMPSMVIDVVASPMRLISVTFR